MKKGYKISILAFSLSFGLTVIWGACEILFDSSAAPGFIDVIRWTAFLLSILGLISGYMASLKKIHPEDSKRNDEDDKNYSALFKIQNPKTPRKNTKN